MRFRNQFLAVFFGIGVGFGSFLIWQDKTEIPLTVVDNQQNLISAVQAQAFILPIAETTYNPIRDFSVIDPVIRSRAALVMDVNSHRTLYALNPDQRLPIASITKLMSAMVILDNLDMDSVYTFSAEDLNVDGLGYDFVQGEQFIGRDLFLIMMMESSNDATSVFESSAQKQDINIVKLMNEKARALGMFDTHFADPQGLNDAETYSTASDVVKLIRASLQYQLLKDALTRSYAEVPSLSGKIYPSYNTNQLLNTIPDIYTGKTGNTPGALGTMTLAVGVGGDDGILAVVLGSQDRFGEIKRLVDWAKRAHKWQE